VTSSAHAHICLVGLSGSGKSTLAPVLAARLGLGASVDLDSVIEQRAGQSVSSIFAELGEEVFRRYEAEALAEALGGPASVIATGGGVVVDQANRLLLRKQATVVWLRTEVSDLVDRLGDSEGSRPLLNGDVKLALDRMAGERDPLYAEVADRVVDVAGLDPLSLAEVVWMALT